MDSSKMVERRMVSCSDLILVGLMRRAKKTRLCVGAPWENGHMLRTDTEKYIFYRSIFFIYPLPTACASTGMRAPVAPPPSPRRLRRLLLSRDQYIIHRAKNAQEKKRRKNTPRKQGSFRHRSLIQIERNISRCLKCLLPQINSMALSLLHITSTHLDPFYNRCHVYGLQQELLPFQSKPDNVSPLRIVVAKPTLRMLHRVST